MTKRVVINVIALVAVVMAPVLVRTQAPNRQPGAVGVEDEVVGEYSAETTLEAAVPG